MDGQNAGNAGGIKVCPTCHKGLYWKPGGGCPACQYQFEALKRLLYGMAERGVPHIDLSLAFKQIAGQRS